MRTGMTKLWSSAVLGGMMSRKLSIIGVVLTAGYFLLLCFVFDGRITEIFLLAPNETGDLLAGMFGPLAILWLILGFFQQGLELRLNTQALELQAQELRNSVEQQRLQVIELKSSVEQQRELVELTRVQIKSEIDAAAIEQNRQRKMAMPNLVLRITRFVGTFSDPDPDWKIFRATLENIGAAATDISVSITSGLQVRSNANFPALKTHEEVKMTIARTEELISEPSIFRVDFTDALGARGSHEFFLIKNSEDRFTGEVRSNSPSE